MFGCKRQTTGKTLLRLSDLGSWLSIYHSFPLVSLPSFFLLWEYTLGKYPNFIIRASSCCSFYLCRRPFPEDKNCPLALTPKCGFYLKTDKWKMLQETSLKNCFVVFFLVFGLRIRKETV